MKHMTYNYLLDVQLNDKVNLPIENQDKIYPQNALISESNI